jgi:hypothetical protein
MGDDPQSRENPQEPAAPSTDTALAQTADQQAKAADTSAQTDDEQTKAADTSHSKSEQGGFLGYARKILSPLRKRTRKIGLLGVVITAMVGFFFGIGSDQVTDYIKRADDCDDAFSQFEIAIDSNFGLLSDTIHDQTLPPDKWAATVQQYNSLIWVPLLKIATKCPVRDYYNNTEYLNKNDVKDWNNSIKNMGDCFNANECSHDKANSCVSDLDKWIDILERQIHTVPQWGLVRRAKYVVTHLY